MKATRVRDRGTVSHRHLAGALMERSGDVALVERGVLRSCVMRCPDGCGDILTINLDPRTDKAWRFYRKRRQVSVFPSIWRDTGCGSHFIIWSHTIVWCANDWREEEVVVEDEENLRIRAYSICTDEWQHFSQIAEKLDEVPWDVNRACSYLSRHTGRLVEGEGKLRCYFKLPENETRDYR